MTLLASIIALIQLFYWLYFYKSLVGVPPPIKNRPSEPVSVIICVKNELVNLRKHLRSFMTQSHSNYELIIADDFSMDNTSEFVKTIDNEKGILKYYEVKQNKRGKKQALAEALDLSKHKWVLLSDGDCLPSSKKWISSMIGHSSQTKRVVLGYSPAKRKAGLLNLWVHYETWYTAIQYLSYAHRGLPYMGVGRNLLYDKTLLTDNTLSKYDHLSSGDDDLTVMQIATGDNTSVCLSPDSFVYTAAPTHWADYWRQKTRHYSTASSYQRLHVVLLGLSAITHVMHYVLIFYFCLSGLWLVAISTYLARILGILPVVNKLRALLKTEFSWKQFLFMDFLQSLHYMIFSFAVLFPQKNNW